MAEQPDAAFQDRGPAETRTAVLHGGRLIAMRVARPGDGLPAGARTVARTLSRHERTVLHGTETLLLHPWPETLADGATVEIEVMRAAIPERGRLKPGRARPTHGPANTPGTAEPTPIDAWPPEVADAWDAAWHAAETGRTRFPGGALVLTPTPAHLAVDVDGDAPGEALATAAVRELARLLRLFGIGGSVVVDLPALPDRAARTRIAEAFDAACTRPHERTAINGFGLLQVVLPRSGPSIIERAWFERDASAAAALARMAIADTGTGPMMLEAPPGVAAWLQARPAVLAAVARRTGRPCSVRAVTHLHAGHVSPA